MTHLGQSRAWNSHQRKVNVYCDFLPFQGVESNDQGYKQLAQICGEAIQKYECPKKIALDVMSSVGRFSYELSKHMKEVL